MTKPINEKTKQDEVEKPKESTKQTPEEKKIRVVPKPTVVTDDFLAEQIWDRKNPPKYLVRYFEKNKFHLASKLKSGHVDNEGREIIYIPVDNSSLRKGLVIVPSKVEETTFKEALERADVFTLKCYDPLEQKPKVKLLTRVCMGSWFLDRFVENPALSIAGAGRFAPIIPIRGPSMSGKNRLAFVLRLLSYRPYFQMSTYRVPSVYRPLNLWQGTLVLDEADFPNTSEKSTLIHFLNSRATGTPISRQDPKNPKSTDTFTNFGLTILTQRRQFDDDATESRSLPYYSEETKKKIPTVETDEMLREGLKLQNMMLYLRMKYFTQIRIDKKVWIKGISDPRLVASLLPLLAIAKFEPPVRAVILDTVKSLEKLKVKQKSESKDGVLINLLCSKIKAELFQVWNHPYYYFLTKTENDSSTVPLTTSTIGEELKWTTRQVRKVLNSLNLCSQDLPAIIKVGKKSWRAIFFRPEKLEKRLRQFVVDYQPNRLFGILKDPIIEVE